MKNSNSYFKLLLFLFCLLPGMVGAENMAMMAKNVSGDFNFWRFLFGCFVFALSFCMLMLSFYILGVLVALWGEACSMITVSLLNRARALRKKI